MSGSSLTKTIQCLFSVIVVFGAQPPVHIVAPAPIHPIGSTQVPHVGHSQPILGQHNVQPVNSQFFEQIAVSSMPAPKVCKNIRVYI